MKEIASAPSIDNEPIRRSQRASQGERRLTCCNLHPVTPGIVTNFMSTRRRRGNVKILRGVLEPQVPSPNPPTCQGKTHMVPSERNAPPYEPDTAKKPIRQGSQQRPRTHKSKPGCTAVIDEVYVIPHHQNTCQSEPFS